MKSIFCVRYLMKKGVAMFALLFAISLFCKADTVRPKSILFFTKSQRTEHSVIKRDGGKPSFAELILADLAAKNNWEITTTKDGTLFTPENLSRYDAFL